MNTFKCSHCGKENKNTNIRCDSCGIELSHVVQNDNSFNKDYSQINLKTIDLGGEKAKHIASSILIFKLAPWFLVGLTFIGVSIYFIISDSNKSKNYLKTEGKLVGYDNCQYDKDGSELCNGVYEYSVNGIIYKGSPSLLSNRSGFKQVVTVNYNPDNPSEYVINSGWNGLLLVGIIMVMIVLAIFISDKIKLKKFFNRVNNVKDGN